MTTASANMTKIKLFLYAGVTGAIVVLVSLYTLESRQVDKLNQSLTKTRLEAAQLASSVNQYKAELQQQREAANAASEARAAELRASKQQVTNLREALNNAENQTCINYVLPASVIDSLPN